MSTTPAAQAGQFAQVAEVLLHQGEDLLAARLEDGRHQARASPRARSSSKSTSTGTWSTRLRRTTPALALDLLGLVQRDAQAVGQVAGQVVAAQGHHAVGHMAPLRNTAQLVASAADVDEHDALVAFLPA